MDVGASFQFLVDALAREWYAIAPDLRGYGRSAWQPQGYWFPDYVADLEALLDAFAPGEAVNLVGHSLGGNVVMHYAGVRPARVRARGLARGLRHSRGVAGRRAEEDSRSGSTRWRDRAEFAPYASLDAVADRLQKNNPRLPRDKANVSRRALGRGRARRHARASRRIRGTSCHFRSVYRMEEVVRDLAQHRRAGAVGRRGRLEHSKWLDEHPEGEAGADNLAGMRRRLEHIPNGRLVTIPDAGHMLHHDQPAAVAAAIEQFLSAASVPG